MPEGALLEDYSNPTYKTLARGVVTSFLLNNRSIPLLLAFDSLVLHLKKWSEVVFNPKSKAAWRRILEKYYETDSYKKLNNAVAGDPMLARYAAIHFLNTLIDRINRFANRGDRRGGKQGGEQILDALQQLANQNPSAFEKAVDMIAAALASEAEEMLREVEVVNSFSHIGIPVAELLEKPDEAREMLRNKIVVNLARLLQKFRRDMPSLRQARMPTLVGGRPLGVKKLQRWSELASTLPTEHIDDDLLSYRIASRTIRVAEKYGSIQNYVVYLDKSGSMADPIIFRDGSRIEHVPKISFAAAAALALAHKLRRYGAKLTLKFFDVDVHQPVTNILQIVEVLMRVRADSGTNITKVLEDAAKHRNERIIVVTDGIDSIDENAAKNARDLDITAILIKTDNEVLRRYIRCIRVDEARPETLISL